MLREWTYGFVYTGSDKRADVLRQWNDHYDRGRPRQGIGGKAPMSRLSTGGNKLLQLHA